MIIFFGPAGAGKSVQAQLLAAQLGWRSLSAGQLLRDSRNSDVLRNMAEGSLVDNDTVNAIMTQALQRAKSVDTIILDGYPRVVEQAAWLIDSQPSHGRSIGAAIVLQVPHDELLERLHIRGRLDDSDGAINERLAIYEEETNPILDYLKSQGVQVLEIDGSGSVSDVHQKIVEALTTCKLI